MAKKTSVNKSADKCAPLRVRQAPEPVGNIVELEDRPFEFVSDFTPTGHQPQAIAGLIETLRAGERHQTLLGVTGSGKTFTMAKVIAELNRPALVLAHLHIPKRRGHSD